MPTGWALPDAESIIALFGFVLGESERILAQATFFRTVDLAAIPTLDGSAGSAGSPHAGSLRHALPKTQDEIHSLADALRQWSAKV